MPENSLRNERKKSYAHIPLALSISMIFSYAFNRISIQLKAVAFLVFSCRVSGSCRPEAFA